MEIAEGTQGTILNVYKYKDMEVYINDSFPQVDCHVSVTNIDTDGTYHEVHLSELEKL
jgi:hypothetical protein